MYTGIDIYHVVYLCVCVCLYLRIRNIPVYNSAMLYVDVYINTFICLFYVCGMGGGG